MRGFISFLIGMLGVLFFIFLRSREMFGEATYLALISVSILVAFGAYAFPRLAEIDIKNLRLTLREVKDATERLEQVKREVAEMYGGIDKLQKEPFVLDELKRNQLGLGEGFATGSATMRYPAGCIKREREGLARVFVNKKEPEEIAKAILDNSLDDQVFKWDGPEVGLDAPPRSVHERDAVKANKNPNSEQ